MSLVLSRINGISAESLPRSRPPTTALDGNRGCQAQSGAPVLYRLVADLEGHPTLHQEALSNT